MTCKGPTRKGDGAGLCEGQARPGQRPALAPTESATDSESAPLPVTRRFDIQLTVSDIEYLSRTPGAAEEPQRSLVASGRCCRLNCGPRGYLDHDIIHDHDARLGASDICTKTSSSSSSKSVLVTSELVS